MAYNDTQSHKANEVKYKILSLLEPHERYYSPQEIAALLRMTPGSVRTRLSALFMGGYIYRRKEYRAKKSAKWYCYRYLKHRGYRVLRGTIGKPHGYVGMHKRAEIKRAIGDSEGIISFLVRKPIPQSIIDKFDKLKEYEKEKLRSKAEK